MLSFELEVMGLLESFYLIFFLNKYLLSLVRRLQESVYIIHIACFFSKFQGLKQVTVQCSFLKKKITEFIIHVHDSYIYYMI